MALVAGTLPFSEVGAELKEQSICHERPDFSGSLQNADHTSCPSLRKLLSHRKSKQGRPPVGEEPEAQGREASGPQPTLSPVAEQGLVPVTQGSIQVPTQSLRDPKVLFIVGL